MSPDEKLTRTTGALLVAVRDHVEQLVGGKHVDAGQLRLTVAARLEQVKAFVGAGLSHRETAKQLGVDKRTIGRDIGQKAPKAGQNAPPKRSPPTDPEEERDLRI